MILALHVCRVSVSMHALILCFVLVIALCQPGTYSESGLEPCKNCSPYYYQLNYGSSSCEPCDDLTNVAHDVCITPTTTYAVVISFINAHSNIFLWLYVYSFIAGLYYCKSIACISHFTITISIQTTIGWV